jgi:hypothetical protein
MRSSLARGLFLWIVARTACLNQSFTVRPSCVVFLHTSSPELGRPGLLLRSPIRGCSRCEHTALLAAIQKGCGNSTWSRTIHRACDRTVAQRPGRGYRSRSKLEFPVDLDRNTVREFGKPDSGARMLAVLRAQQLVEEVRCPIDHLRHPVEPWSHIDHSH